MKKIAIVGSINTDFIFKSIKQPMLGETIKGEKFAFSFGGKGANEAVACARLGAKVSLFGAVGDDMFSRENLLHLKKEKVDIKNVEIIKDCFGGVAEITLLDKTNSIIVIPGANEKLNDDYLIKIKEELASYDIVGLQAEIPTSIIERVIDLMYEQNKTIVFNPSPMQKFKKILFDKSTYIIVNEVEVKCLPGYKNENQILELYNGKVILTCGKQGVYFFDKNKVCHEPAKNYGKILDTTGAGDTFMGAFIVAMSEGKSLKECVEFSNKCAGKKCTKFGAQTGMPTRNEIQLI